MKNYRDLGGCYPPRPTALTDNTSPLFFIRYSVGLLFPHLSKLKAIGHRQNKNALNVTKLGREVG